MTLVCWPHALCPHAGLQEPLGILLSCLPPHQLMETKA